MTDKKISELPSLSGASKVNTDILPIVDVSTSTTSKITVTDLLTNPPLNGIATGTAITQSNADSTAGRLLKVGDFGLGWTTVDRDANGASLATGFFRANPSIPVFGGFGHAIHISRVTNAQSGQLAIRDASSSTPPLAAIRHRDGTGTWAEWNVLYGRQNILGSVAQTGGVPTNAIIERGSNANGNYVRFADGTQICQFVVNAALSPNVAIGSIFYSTEYAWTFPAVFANTEIFVSVSPRNSADVWGKGRVAGASSGAVRLFAAVSTGAITIDMLAVGRWF